MPFFIVQNDIIKMKTDAIVNVINTSFLEGGVCGAIFKATTSEKMQDMCNKLPPIRLGEAVITSGFNLSVKYVIHTAAPVYHNGTQMEENLLYSCYKNSLLLAVKNKCRSISLPLISSGVYGFPKGLALKIATSTIEEFMLEYNIKVYLVVFDSFSLEISDSLLGEVESFVEEHYINESAENIGTRRLIKFEKLVLSEGITTMPMISGEKLEDIISKLDESFSDTLFKLIDIKGMTDVEVYKKANIDRKLFSKIRSAKGYMPSKKTAIALAVALELNINETKELLEKAGYTLSRSQKFDVIIEYFIVSKKYNIFEINEVLFHYDQPLLGA